MTPVESSVTVGQQLDTIDRACLITAVALVVGCLVIAVMLSKCMSDCQFTDTARMC